VQAAADSAANAALVDFASFGLGEPILKAVTEKGYTKPSPIQGQCIPAVLAGHDVMAAAQTGTGKTYSLLNPGHGGDHSQAGLVPRLAADLFTQTTGDIMAK
jgi:ATP-dependent RNA helicase RhlE